jgi:hypothetical protein
LSPTSWRFSNDALPTELLMGPLMTPDVCVSTSSTVIGREAGTL